MKYIKVARKDMQKALIGIDIIREEIRECYIDFGYSWQEADLGSEYIVAPVLVEVINACKRGSSSVLLVDGINRMMDRVDDLETYISKTIKYLIGPNSQCRRKFLETKPMFGTILISVIDKRM